MENLNEESAMAKEEMDKQIQKTIEAKVKALRASDSKLKRIYPVYVEGDEYDEKEYYIAYLKQPSFPAFSKYLALSQKDQAGAMRELAKDCFVDGDKELVNDESLFIYGLMPVMARIIETRNSKIVNLAKAGK